MDADILIEKFSELVGQYFQQGMAELGLFDVSMSEFSAKLSATLEGIYQDDLQKQNFETIDERIKNVHTTDLILTIALAKGDEQAWRVFNQKYENHIRINSQKYANNPTMANEIATGLVGMLMLPSSNSSHPRIASYNGRGSLSSWLRMVIFREMLAYNRKKHMSDIEQISLIDSDEYPSDRELEIFQKVVVRGFRAISIHDKKLLREYYIQRNPEKKLASQYGVHVSTISRRLQRICKHLLKEFESIAAEEFGVGNDLIQSMMSKFKISCNENIREILR